MLWYSHFPKRWIMIFNRDRLLFRDVLVRRAELKWSWYQWNLLTLFGSMFWWNKYQRSSMHSGFFLIMKFIFPLIFCGHWFIDYLLQLMFVLLASEAWDQFILNKVYSAKDSLTLQLSLVICTVLNDTF